jgi:cytochrome c oxidase subunit III
MVSKTISLKGEGAMQQQKRIHPHKFIMWIAIGSILMMFFGFTSAYIVKRNQANWFSFQLPLVFWYSTAAIILSSITIWLAEKRFKQRQMAQYRGLITATFILGILFVVLQVIGFASMTKNGLPLQKNVSVSFLYVIVGVHALHVVGGIIALMVLFAKAFSSKIKNYDIVPVQVMGTYWHFVDFLWIYLLIFLLAIR